MLTHRVKQATLAAFADLQGKGDVNTIDICEFTSEVASHIVFAILAGEGASFTKLPYTNISTGQES